MDIELPRRLEVGLGDELLHDVEHVHRSNSSLNESFIDPLDRYDLNVPPNVHRDEPSQNLAFAKLSAASGDKFYTLNVFVSRCEDGKPLPNAKCAFKLEKGIEEGLFRGDCNDGWPLSLSRERSPSAISGLPSGTSRAPVCRNAE